MLKNFIKLFLKTIKKRKFIYLLNFISLTVALTVFLFLFCYFEYHRDYENLNPSRDSIYRIDLLITQDQGNTRSFAGVFKNVGQILHDEIPSVVNYVRIHPPEKEAIIANEDFSFTESNLFYTDTSVFSMFSIQLIEGTVEKLNEPRTVFLSETTAKKFFGQKNPIGEKVQISGFFVRQDYTIVGIFKDQPSNTHVKMNMICSLDYILENYRNEWIGHWFRTYLKLNKETSPELENKINKVLLSKYETEIIKNNEGHLYYLEQLNKIHTSSKVEYDFETNMSYKDLIFALSMGILFLIISLINGLNSFFIILMERAKELGVKKVIGVEKSKLVFEYLLENSIIFLLANFVTVIVFRLISMDVYSKFGESMTLEILANINYWKILLLIFLIQTSIIYLGILGYFRVFDLNTLLKGAGIKRNYNIRNILVASQFFIALVFLICTTVIYSQIQFLKKKNIGLDIEETVVFQIPGMMDLRNRQLPSKLDAFRKELNGYNQIQSISFTGCIPGDDFNNYGGLVKNNSGNVESYRMHVGWVDAEYIEKLNLLAGNNFNRELIRNRECILSKNAAYMMGYTYLGDAIGDSVISNTRKFKIIGVVDDYNHNTLNQEAKPFYFLRTSFVKRGYALVKLNSSIDSEAIELIDQKFSEFFPSFPFQYFFLDDFYYNNIKSEFQFYRLMLFISILILIITFIGLWNISYNFIIIKKKESDIRKAHGASPMNITFFLLWNYSKIISICLLGSLIVSYFIVQNWLSNFPYRVSLDANLFILPILIGILILLVCTIPHFLRLAYSKPVLKSEGG